MPPRCLTRICRFLHSHQNTSELRSVSSPSFSLHSYFILILLNSSLPLHFITRRAWLMSMSLLLLFASPPIPALPANQQLKIYGKPINHRHLKSSRVSATRDDVDAFTEKSSYLFKLSSTDADSIVEYDLRKIASVYRRKPLILLRRVFQVGTTFGWWFGSRFVDELMERSDQMFPVRSL